MNPGFLDFFPKKTKESKEENGGRNLNVLLRFRDFWKNSRNFTLIPDSNFSYPINSKHLRRVYLIRDKFLLFLIPKRIRIAAK